jgi:hypothetical protein
MTLVIVTLVIDIQKTDVINFGMMSGAFDVLSLLRGFICSPNLLSMPIKRWLRSNHKISNESYFYFFLAIIKRL